LRQARRHEAEQERKGEGANTPLVQDRE